MNETAVNGEAGVGEMGLDPSVVAGSSAPRGWRLAGALFRNEWLKTFKRLATWVVIGLYTFILCVSFGEQYFDARGDPEEVFALPAAWSEILGEMAIPGLIFGGVLLILLVAGEFSWRTARQNVIDGLSKQQWFWAKSILMPLLALLFVGALVLIGGTFGYLGTDTAAAVEPLIRGGVWAAIGGTTLAFLLLGSMAFAAAMAVRSSGGAMAVWFFYIAFGETLLRGGLAQLGEWIEPALRFAPFRLVQAAAEYIQWDPVAFAQAVERAVANDRTPPEIWEPGTLVLAMLAWVAFFVLASFLWFRRRDL